MSLTRPLELEKTLTLPERRIDAVPMIDVLLIALFIMALGSRFIYAPGVGVDLSLQLPASAGTFIEAVPTDAALTVKVLTAKQDNLYIFDGSIYSLNTLEQMFKDYKQLEEGTATLLVKADKSVAIDTLVKIADLARTARFAKIQLAVVADAGR